MELNSKKLEKTSKLLYWTISVILCVFLILLAQKIMGDMESVTSQPEVSQFRSTTINGVMNQRQTLREKQQDLDEQNQRFLKAMDAAHTRYTEAKNLFDNWIVTRKTLGQTDQDTEVLVRVRELDELKAIEQTWRSKITEIQTQKESLYTQDQFLAKKENALEQQAFKSYTQALRQYELKIFLYRLLFVGPVLALGIYFFLKKRRHQYWPLFMGFTLFSFYAFFFGLVPYLPSYGGYVRYAVGILLSIGLGYYAIKHLRNYLAQKQAELKISTQERAKKVDTSVAEKALDNHFCPSCGKDFLLRKWEFPIGGIAKDIGLAVSDFCRHCGLELFSDCGRCGHKNFAHLPYCSQCGNKNQAGESQHSNL